MGGSRGEWIIGLINSIIFLTAGLIGAFIVDPLNHYLGRRGEIFLTGVCLTLTPIGSGLAQSWQGLFAARFVMGIGIGAKNATVPIFSSEVAPARVRGALVMFWQLWVTAGIFMGFCANVIVKDFRSMNKLRAHPIIAARDYYYSFIIYEEEKLTAAGAGYFRRMWDCFAIPRIRRSNYGASTVMIAQQMCGI